MTNTISKAQSELGSRFNEAFPILTTAQIARIAPHGHKRRMQQGEVLIHAGEISDRFYIIISGQIQAVIPLGSTEELVAVCQPGMFTGEITMLSGHRGLVQLRASSPGEVIELDRKNLLAFIQSDSELSDILMRAFILRRVELISHQFGDVVLVGSNNCCSNTSHQRVPDAQWPPLFVYRP